MAIGLSPKYLYELPLENLSRQQFLVLALEAAHKQNWDIGPVSEKGFIAYTRPSLDDMSEEVKFKIDNHTVHLQSECAGKQMIDQGRNKVNIKQFIETFNQLKDIYSAEGLSKKYEELKPSLVSGEGGILNRPPATRISLTTVFSIFIPKQGFFVTPILIDLNVAIYILMVASGVSFMQPDNESLIKWGANFRPVTLDGQWWRLITCCFIHIGIFHLLMNMYALFYIGLLLEPHLGRKRFTAVYLLTGVASSTCSLYWHDTTISAGASGAIFGLYGVFFAMLTSNLIKNQRLNLLRSIGIFIVYNLVYGMKAGIDNAAHIGGLVSGLVTGYAFYASLKNRSDIKLKYGTIGALTVLITAGAYAVYHYTPNDLGQYDKQLKKFTKMETAALGFYKLPKDASKEQKLTALKDSGYYYWNENLKLLDGLHQLNLPIESRVVSVCPKTPVFCHSKHNDNILLLHLGDDGAYCISSASNFVLCGGF